MPRKAGQKGALSRQSIGRAPSDWQVQVTGGSMVYHQALVLSRASFGVEEPKV